MYSLYQAAEGSDKPKISAWRGQTIKPPNLHDGQFDPFHSFPLPFAHNALLAPILPDTPGMRGLHSSFFPQRSLTLQDPPTSPVKFHFTILRNVVPSLPLNPRKFGEGMSYI
jgi:hypothetical protein